MTATIQTELGALPLTYVLTEEERDGVTQYGVAISTPDETAAAPCISPDRAKTEALLRLLCASAVTPTALADIIEDYLAA